MGGEGGGRGGGYWNLCVLMFLFVFVFKLGLIDAVHMMNV